LIFLLFCSFPELKACKKFKNSPNCLGISGNTWNSHNCLGNTGIPSIAYVFLELHRHFWKCLIPVIPCDICTGMDLGSRCTVDRDITASQEQWDGHFFVGIWIYSDKCFKGLKAPTDPQYWLLHKFLYCLSWVWAWERERVGVAWSDKALDLRVHWSVFWKCTGLAEIWEYSESEISWT
jgi:hypothetical protein